MITRKDILYNHKKYEKKIAEYNNPSYSRIYKEELRIKLQCMKNIKDFLLWDIRRFAPWEVTKKLKH